MVRAIFCHYLPIYKDVNGVYCSTTLTDSLFRRYLHVADELLVATRVYPSDKTYEELHQEKITLPNVKILEFPNLSTVRGILVEKPKARKKLKEAIETCDMVFLRGGIIAGLGGSIAKELNKPYLTECAGCAWDEYWNHSLKGKILAPYMEWGAKKGTKEAPFVVYVTEKWLQNRYPTDGISTYASNVYLEKLDERVLEARLKKLENMEHGVLRFGTTAGVGNKAKGQQFMIQAMAKLKDEFDIRYELVGGGDNSYLKDVARKCGMGDKVIFKGELTHDEVLCWIDELDVYIQPSMQEGLPRALIEAMSRACPAIGSTTAGIPELLTEDVIFQRGNVNALVDKIRYLLGQDFVPYAKRNFEKAKEFEIEKLNARRYQIFEQFRDFALEKKV